MMQIYRDYVVRNHVIEVPDDYRAWEQVKKNGREQFIANHRLSLLLFGLAVIALVVLGGWLLVRRQRH
jgi:arylsulfatase